MTHYVYRCYDAADRLLYVGCTQDVGARIAVHMASGHNPASRVLIFRMARHEVVTYATEAEAKQAERDAIYNEAPLANLHHQRVRETPDQRARRISAYIEATRPAPDPEWDEISLRMTTALASWGNPKAESA
jgi:predicted GIY-YIG superfamily endonuclease